MKGPGEINFLEGPKYLDLLSDGCRINMSFIQTLLVLLSPLALSTHHYLHFVIFTAVAIISIFDCSLGLLLDKLELV